MMADKKYTNVYLSKRYSKFIFDGLYDTKTEAMFNRKRKGPFKYEGPKLIEVVTMPNPKEVTVTLKNPDSFALL